MSRNSITIALLALAVLCGLLYGAYVRSQGIAVTEHSLGNGITDASTVLAGPDGLHAAFIAKKAGRQWVVTDGRSDKAYDCVPADSLQFSPNGQTLAYAARRGSKEFLVVNHHEWPPFDKVMVESITMSPDGRHVACVVGSHGRQAAVYDGVPSRFYDRIGSLGSSFGSRWLYFSPDGRRLAFVAQRKAKQFVVLDGSEGQTYDWIGTLIEWLEPERSSGGVQFSPDSRHVAYAARTRGKWFAVVDGVQGRAYGTILDVSVADRGRLAYVAGTHSFLPPRTADADVTDWWRSPSTWGKLCIVIDGREVERFSWREGHYTGITGFSPDGRRVAFKVQRGAKQSMVIDGRKGKDYDDVDGPLFSPDGRRVAYVATINSRETYPMVVLENGVRMVYRYPKSIDRVLVVDGKETTRYKGIRSVTFSPDSRRMAFMAATALHTSAGDTQGDERLRWSVVVNGKAGRRYVDLYEYEGISFSPDSRHVSYTAFRWIRGIKRSITVLDGKEYGEGFPVTFGAGGRRTAVACMVWPKRGLYIVVDGSKRLTLVSTREASRLIKRYGAYLNVDQTLFTRDGKHLAYAYSVGATRDKVALRRFIGMDGHVAGEYDRVLLLRSEPETVLAPTGPSGVSALVVRNGELLRLEIRPRSRSAI